MEVVTGDEGEGDEVTEAVGVGGNPGTATPGLLLMLAEAGFPAR